eukprot:2110586-Amphidinium_carterae.1
MASQFRSLAGMVVTRRFKPIGGPHGCWQLRPVRQLWLRQTEEQVESQARDSSFYNSTVYHYDRCTRNHLWTSPGTVEND